MNGDVLGVRREGTKVAKVTAKNGATRLSSRHHEGVHRRALLRLGPQHCRPPGESFR